MFIVPYRDAPEFTLQKLREKFGAMSFQIFFGAVKALFPLEKTGVPPRKKIPPANKNGARIKRGSDWFHTAGPLTQI